MKSPDIPGRFNPLGAHSRDGEIRAVRADLASSKEKLDAYVAREDELTGEFFERLRLPGRAGASRTVRDVRNGDQDGGSAASSVAEGHFWAS